MHEKNTVMVRPEKPGQWLYMYSHYVIVCENTYCLQVGIVTQLTNFNSTADGKKCVHMSLLR